MTLFTPLRYTSIFVATMLAACCAYARAAEPSFPYRDDPAVLKILAELKPGQSAWLPRPVAWGDGKT